MYVYARPAPAPPPVPARPGRVRVLGGVCHVSRPLAIDGVPHQDLATANPAHYEEALAASVSPELGVGLDVTRVQRLLLLAVRSTDAALGCARVVW